MNFFKFNLLILLTLSIIPLFIHAQNYNPYDNTTYQEHSTIGVSAKEELKMAQLKNSKFMQGYATMQIEIEETIKLVKSNEHLYSPQDIYQIKIAYRTTAQEFNRVLNELKRDLLKGKYKAKNSVYFNRDLEHKHYFLTKFYQTNFKKPLEVIMEEEIAVSRESKLK